MNYIQTFSIAGETIFHLKVDGITKLDIKIPPSHIDFGPTKLSIIDKPLDILAQMKIDHLYIRRHAGKDECGLIFKALNIIVTNYKGEEE